MVSWCRWCQNPPNQSSQPDDWFTGLPPVHVITAGSALIVQEQKIQLLWHFTSVNATCLWNKQTNKQTWWVTTSSSILCEGNRRGSASWPFCEWPTFIFTACPPEATVTVHSLAAVSMHHCDRLRPLPWPHGRNRTGPLSGCELVVFVQAGDVEIHPSCNPSHPPYTSPTTTTTNPPTPTPPPNL